ncbi:MAG: beta-glucosidase BglX [Flavobacteriaceae bacterium]|nr:beta-glucosidase BglX [Flavobacteriaceae bacterium]
MKSLNFILIIVLMNTLHSCQNNSASSGSNQSPYAKQVDSLLSIMTLEEKVGQMNQYSGFWEVTGPAPEEGSAAHRYEQLRKGLIGSMLNVTGVENVKALQKIAVEETRLGIPLIIGYDVIHGYKTMAPIPLAESASWDLEAIKKSAEVAAAEAAAAGINWTFAPMVDISRDARWGRVMEGAGEDPYLGSLIAKARVQGFQGTDLKAPNTIAATAKHFAGYGFAEAGRDYNTVDIGTSTLYNQVFPPFKAATDAGVKTFMNAFNVLNGVPATGNAFLQRDILKGKWNFDGFVVSDWGSIKEMITHGYAKDGKAAAELAANAGSDMDMESSLYVEHLATLVKEGKVDETLIDDAVKRILTLKYELGLFENPYLYCDEAREKEVIGKPAFHEAVLDMAKKSIVLLKNEKQLLPLKKKGLKIALLGQLAGDKDSPLGSWRALAAPNSAVSVQEGLKKYPDNDVQFEQGVRLTNGTPSFLLEAQINTTDRSGFEAAKNIAKQAEVVVIVLGEHAFQSGEARSRTELGLPGLQQEFLEEIYKVNPNIVLVLMNGRPLAIEWAAANIPAIVEAWQLGTESGNAIAEVLYGDYNPSGKLTMTFPINVGQVPIYYNHKNTGRPVLPDNKQIFWSHYIDAPNSPLFPFGYGLSYTSFEYKNLQVNKESFSKGGSIEVSIEVTNTGDLPGKETVQLYLQDLYASVSRPVKELKGFEQVNLQPRESRRVTFTIDEEKIGFFDNEGNWKVESGEFKVFVGGNSVNNLESVFLYEE